jgi:cellulose synthase/poly-beta-1,6-N-acetylglucosamine synthase-like glycosyltransferase
MSHLLGLAYSLGFAFLACFGLRMAGLTLGLLWSRRRERLGLMGLVSNAPASEASTLKGEAAARPQLEASDVAREQKFDEALYQASCEAWPAGYPPFVTVQLPLYNERLVAGRAIDALCRLRWPAGRIEIQVFDDSEDETRALVDARAALWRARGHDIAVHRRSGREGFKAGALAMGLEQARGDAIAIFDADFLPAPDFLELCLPHLGPGVAAVQARWGHLNARDSRLTRVQALALDGHFLVEQDAQSRLGLFLNFNGTAGVWRREAIEAAGGWQGDTLTEDFDLSYRAQLAGWRICMRPEIVAPAELPDSLPAYRRQQQRWARGTVQVLRKLGRRVLSAPLPLHRRILALATLSGYLVHPVMLALLLASPLLLVFPPHFPAALSLLAIAPFCPPLLYAVALAGTERGWPRRLLDYPLLALLTVGMSLAGTRAVAGGLFGRTGSFERTPKRGERGERGFGRKESSSPAPAEKARQVWDYRLPLGRQSWAEAALAGYAWLLVAAAWRAGAGWLVGFGLLYALGFSLVLGMALAELGRRDDAVTVEAGASLGSEGVL